MTRGKDWNRHREKVTLRLIKKKERKKEKFNKDNKRTLLKNPHYNSDKRNRFKKKILELKFPEIVRFDDNFEETTSAFEKLVNIMSSERSEIKCYFNLRNVVDIGTDVIMYMVALVTNLKVSKIKKISFTGNLPDNIDAKKKIINTGFLDYVNVKNKKEICKEYYVDKRRTQIKNGRETDPESSAKIVEQLMEITGKKVVELNDLYVSLIELKNNTVEHAKNRSKRFNSNEWYLYTEEFEDYVEYIFLDTGPGIPDTVHKKFFENLFQHKKDVELIESALNGEFRSKTKEKTRGNGLPTIKRAVIDGILDDMTIYSGKGECIIKNGENKILKKEHDNKFEGTLFKWKIMKG